MLNMYLPSGNVDCVPGGDCVPNDIVDYVPSRNVENVPTQWKC